MTHQEGIGSAFADLNALLIDLGPAAIAEVFATLFARAEDWLKARGARSVAAYCTHAVLSGKAIENINASELDELVVTDTIPLTDEAAACTRIRQLSVATLLGESINRMNSGQSLSSMFID